MSLRNEGCGLDRAAGLWKVLMYRMITHAIEVSVEPTYLPEHSAPEMNRYVWSYTITIRNVGAETVRLRNRHWRITNANGEIEEVQGVGVVGEQPVLEPGQAFTYTSGCPLTTSSGIMVGRYEMERANGERFHAVVPPFSLDVPGDRPPVH